MNVIAINGGPRKGWNTHTLLEKALEGAQAEGAQTQMIHLYDIDYKGCVSCFACKRKGARLDACAVKDGLYPVLDAIAKCDALLIGSPIYFGDVTGQTRSLIERLCFPYISYDNQPTSFGRQIQTALIYTMNCPASALDRIGYTQRFEQDAALLRRIFGNAELLLSTETYQFDDYEKYAASMIDATARKQRRETIFPAECESAYQLGARLAQC